MFGVSEEFFTPWKPMRQPWKPMRRDEGEPMGQTGTDWDWDSDKWRFRLGSPILKLYHNLPIPETNRGKTRIFITILAKSTVNQCLGYNWVVVLNIFNVHPENWGRWTHFDSYFSDGLVQPPTSNPGWTNPEDLWNVGIFFPWILWTNTFQEFPFYIWCYE